MFVWFPFALLTLQQSSSSSPSTSVTSPSMHLDAFQHFLEIHHKSYADIEFLERFQIFKKSLQRIKQLNSRRDKEESAWYGITPYSDLTKAEFERKVIRRKDENGANWTQHQEHHRRFRRSLDSLPSDIPKRVDWREKGIISSVNNQGKCGACWAFSSVETIESMVAMRSNSSQVQKLSVQELIDCAADGYNRGCDGGDTCEALEWMQEQGARLVTEVDYPTRDTAGSCDIEPTTASGVQISSYTCDNKTGSETDMIRALATHGPLIAAVDATTWQDYLGGIIQFHCETNRNHAVQIVGYDLTGPIPYYIVRNTWGSEFGLDGYLHIEIGKNLCAIAEEVSQVDVVIK